MSMTDHYWLDTSAWRIQGDPRVSPGALLWCYRGKQWLVLLDGECARVDGGDPGDEHDGE